MLNWLWQIPCNHQKGRRLFRSGERCKSNLSPLIHALEKLKVDRQNSCSCIEMIFLSINYILRENYTDSKRLDYLIQNISDLEQALFNCLHPTIWLLRKAVISFLLLGDSFERAYEFYAIKLRPNPSISKRYLSMLV